MHAASIVPHGEKSTPASLYATARGKVSTAGPSQDMTSTDETATVAPGPDRLASVTMLAKSSAAASAPAAAVPAPELPTAAAAAPAHTTAAGAAAGPAAAPAGAPPATTEAPTASGAYREWNCPYPTGSGTVASGWP